MNKQSKSKKSAKSSKRPARKPGKAEPGEAIKRLAKKAEGALMHAEEAVMAAVTGKPAKKKPAQKKAAAKKTEGNGVGPTKQYLKSRPAVKVTFRLPGEAADGAEHVSLVGEFNGWSADATPMKKLKSGDFTATMELEKGRDYRFRYLIEGQRWENDWRADRYEPNAFGCDDSVITC